MTAMNIDSRRRAALLRRVRFVLLGVGLWFAASPATAQSTRSASRAFESRPTALQFNGQGLLQAAYIQQAAPSVPPAPATTVPRMPAAMRPLHEVSLDIGIPVGTTPDEPFAKVAAAKSANYDELRSEEHFNYSWEPPSIAVYAPLFDDVPLERYGYSLPDPLQPLVSGAKFYGNVVLVPYRIGAEGLTQKKYVAGYDRMGSRARRVRGWVPWSWRGIATEAAAVTGYGFLIP